MKSFAIRLFANIALLVCLLGWIHGGARSGFYHDRVTRMVADPILGIAGPKEVPGFYPGIETMVAGLLLFLALHVAAIVIERRVAVSNLQN